MSKIKRFGVSLEEDLLEQLDSFIRRKNFANRSQGIRNLIRERLVEKEWVEGGEVAGAITLVYDHHKRELLETIIDTQHHFLPFIVSTQHIHLDEDNCLEIVAVKGRAKEIRNLFYKMKGIKRIKHSSLAVTTTGKKMA